MSLNKFTIQKSFAINAGAGSGKTYTLSRRYINAILGFDFFREKGFKNMGPAKLSETYEVARMAIRIGYWYSREREEVRA